MSAATITCRLCPWRATRSSNRRAVAALRVHVADCHPPAAPMPERPSVHPGPPEPLQPRTRPPAGS